MKQKILILGKGYIGRELQNHFKCAISTKKIYSLQDALSVLASKKPDIIINCIGHTGKKNVDDCELKIDKTLHSNTFIPIILAEACLRKKVKLVHICSGCIYHYDYKKDNPIPESKMPDHYDLFYNRTKIYSGIVLENIARHHHVLIVRIRLPLDNKPHPKNILTKLIKYKKIINLPNSVTYLPDFLEALDHLLKRNASGLYNIVNKGALRYPALLDVYRKHVPAFHYSIVKLKNLDLVRPSLILSTRKLEKSGFNVRPIQKILNECVEQYVKHSARSE